MGGVAYPTSMKAISTTGAGTKGENLYRRDAESAEKLVAPSKQIPVWQHR
jgi:hypothetical protein